MIVVSPVGDILSGIEICAAPTLRLPQVGQRFFAGAAFKQ